MRLPTLCLSVLALTSECIMAETLRCGTQLINEGDRAFEVEKKCGPPVYRDLVGYTLTGYDRREFKIEEWVYGPTNGKLSILTFEANRLVRIESRRDR